MYNLIKSVINDDATILQRLYDNTFIPVDPANTDYQTFRKDVAGGVELQDADGNVMTQAQVDDFLKTIPE